MDQTLDLSTLDAVDTTDVIIIHPSSKEPIGLVITVYGYDSEHYQKLQRAKINKRLAAKNRKPLTSEQMERESIELLAKSTKCWAQGGQETVLVAGECLPYTPDNAITLYTRFPFIKEQVDEAIGDRTLFIKS